MACSAPSSVLSSPSSLKGITSTNDDQHACSFCSKPFSSDEDSTLYGLCKACCGKSICEDCEISERSMRLWTYDRTLRCSFCNLTAQTSRKTIFGALKKHAKKGEAWGQQCIASCYETGTFLSQSDYYEAKRWYEKAAKQGHPEAMYRLGKFYLKGIGGYSADFSKARELAEKAMSLDSRLTGRCYSHLVNVARSVDDNEEASSILIPIAIAGVAIAQNNLGVAMSRENDNTNAKRCLETAALQGNKVAALNIFVCCGELLDMPEANFWFNIVSKSEIMPPKQEDIKILETVGRKLRELRDICGGCGADLEGDRRSYCKHCKTYCCCSSECQKLHWNRIEEEGHRSECIVARGLKEKMKATHQHNVAEPLLPPVPVRSHLRSILRLETCEL